MHKYVLFVIIYNQIKTQQNTSSEHISWELQ